MLDTNLGWQGLRMGWGCCKVDITELEGALEPGLDRIIGIVLKSVLSARYL